MEHIDRPVMSRLARHSAPDYPGYADFCEIGASQALDNRCFFSPRPISLQSPLTPLRKVFIVTANSPIPQMIWRTSGGRTSTAIDWKAHSGHIFIPKYSQLGRNGEIGCPQVTLTIRKDHLPRRGSVTSSQAVVAMD